VITSTMALVAGGRKLGEALDPSQRLAGTLSARWADVPLRYSLAPCMEEVVLVVIALCLAPNGRTLFIVYRIVLMRETVGSPQLRRS
jgi:hypothetical protein